jgi:RNA-directed DNA polymerase
VRIDEMVMQKEVKQLELFKDERGLFKRLCTRAELEAGFLAVKRNGGSPGIDGITISDFDIRRDEELKCLKRELESWTYQPSPVRRVEIPKPGKDAGVRLLGIPSDLPAFIVCPG